MDIDSRTKVYDPVDAYPYLVEWLGAYSSMLAKLQNPAMLATVARIATLEVAAGNAGVTVDVFLDDIRAEIARHEGEDPGAREK